MRVAGGARGTLLTNQRVKKGANAYALQRNVAAARGIALGSLAQKRRSCSPHIRGR